MDKPLKNNIMEKEVNELCKEIRLLENQNQSLVKINNHVTKKLINAQFSKSIIFLAGAVTGAITILIILS